MRTVAITGAGGYIGKKLIGRFESEGYECVPIKRDFLTGKADRVAELLARCDMVVHLAGAPVLQRWTAKSKAEIYNSRVLSTRKLVEAIEFLPVEKRPELFLSASAVGIYQSGETHDESSTCFDPGFLGKLVQDWEAASMTLPGEVRRVVFRIGLVLAGDSKTIQTMLPAFKLGLGGKIGSGKQAFPFVYTGDLVSAFLWAVRNSNANGVYNLVAPQAITNSEFTTQLAKKLKRPAFFTVPPFALRLVYGDAACLLTQSPLVVPERLIREGFQFSKPTIDDLLEGEFSDWERG